MKILAGTSRPELEQWAENAGEKKFRARQIADWLYGKLEMEPSAMENLPKSLREKLAADFFAPSSRVRETVESPDGTEKLLLELSDGEVIEMVLIPGKDGRITFCLSTQVGCPVRCYFCASGKNGLTRNLTAGEILEEFLHGCKRIGRKPDNLVFMGIGEGLLNFENLKTALDRLTGAEYFSMSPRRITVSTSGSLDGIEKLAQLGKEYTLAISLHAPDDETRSRLIPDPLRAKVSDLVEAAKRYESAAGRMVTFEYTLLDGINDSDEHAGKLAKLARECHAKINLIAYNPTESEFRRPPRIRIDRFKELIDRTGAHVTLRVEHGSKEAAACGQLRIHVKESI